MGVTRRETLVGSASALMITLAGCSGSLRRRRQPIERQGTVLRLRFFGREDSRPLEYLLCELDVGGERAVFETRARPGHAELLPGDRVRAWTHDKRPRRGRFYAERVELLAPTSRALCEARVSRDDVLAVALPPAPETGAVLDGVVRSRGFRSVQKLPSPSHWRYERIYYPMQRASYRVELIASAPPAFAERYPELRLERAASPADLEIREGDWVRVSVAKNDDFVFWPDAITRHTACVDARAGA